MSLCPVCFWCQYLAKLYFGKKNAHIRFLGQTIDVLHSGTKIFMEEIIITRSLFSSGNPHLPLRKKKTLHWVWFSNSAMTCVDSQREESMVRWVWASITIPLEPLLAWDFREIPNRALKCVVRNVWARNKTFSIEHNLFYFKYSII